jgi:hypothetical protein
VDNPGKWHHYYTKPVQAKDANNKLGFKGYALPMGYIPAPKNNCGLRLQGGYQMHYQGWDVQSDKVVQREMKGQLPFRSGATRDNLFPSERGSELDWVLLKSLGLKEEHARDCDAHFFLNLLLPIECVKKRSVIKNDPRRNYHEANADYTFDYARHVCKLGGSYNHSYEMPTPTDLVHFEGILILDGAAGGSNGALYRKWNPYDIAYEPRIKNAMTLTRYLQLKRTFKLDPHYNGLKKDDPLYNPGYKFQDAWQTLVHNTNALTLWFDTDQVIDETTWGHQGYGEPGLMTRIQNKPGITKGGQLVLCMDKNKNYIRACEVRYSSRGKLEKVEGWANFIGPLEMKKIVDKFDGLYPVGVEPVPRKHKFKGPPHITGDNFFPSDDILDYMGKKGFAGKSNVA